jgi:hypothetical protein
MVRSAPLQRLDTLTYDVTVLESDVANIESNVAILQTDVANLAVVHVVETANVTGNLILNSANGVAYYLSVDDGGNLTTVSVT